MTSFYFGYIISIVSSKIQDGASNIKQNIRMSLTYFKNAIENFDVLF